MKQVQPNSAESSELKSDGEAGAAAAVERIEGQWRAVYEARLKEVVATLVEQYPQAPADEKLLSDLAAHDFVIAELLGDAQVRLANRVGVLLDNPKVALALARSLEEVSDCRNGTTRRVAELLQAAGVLRGQRRFTQHVPLRRVV